MSLREVEKVVYRELKDIISQNSFDYDPKATNVKRFFADLQNYTLFAITEKTAAEIIINRFQNTPPKFGLQYHSGKNGPTKKDITIACNYLYKHELERKNDLILLIRQNCVWDSKYDLQGNLDLWAMRIKEIINSKNQPLWDRKHKLNKHNCEKRVREIYEDYKRNKALKNSSKENRRKV